MSTDGSWSVLAYRSTVHSWPARPQTHCTIWVLGARLPPGAVRHLLLLTLRIRTRSEPGRGSNRQLWWLPPLIGHWVSGAPSPFDAPEISRTRLHEVVMRYVF